MQQINLRLDKIFENRSNLGIGNGRDKGEPSVPIIRNGRRSAKVEEVDIVGIEDEAGIISKMLIGRGARTSVVSIVGMGGLDPTSNPYELRLLKDEECWELLRKKAFRKVVHHVHLEELEKVGKDIARGCNGLPLAAVVLGGLLSSKDQSIHEWR
ncbi:hypothetical protein AAC387_Pa07g1473 [Persea americana]